MASIKINIGGDKRDQSYRYQMPALECTVEGHRTVFLNIAQVAQCLHVMPQYIMKYFSLELGTQSNFDEQSSRGAVKGKHPVSVYQALLDKFITGFVLCPKCKLPEINMSVQTNAQIRTICAACGDKRAFESTHKLTRFIVANPPTNETASAAHRNAEQVRQSQDEATTVIQPIEKKEVEWHSEVSLDAQRQRLKRDLGEQSKEELERTQKIATIIAAATEIGAEKNPATLLHVYLVQAERSVHDIYNEIRRLQLSRGLDESRKFKLILEVFVDVSEPKQLPKQFSNKQTQQLIAKFVDQNTTAAAMFINCVEDFVGVTHPKLLPYFPLILKQCYESDILTEEQLFHWFNQSAGSSWLVQADLARQTREKAQPLMNWLSQDEDEDDEE